MQGLRKSRMGTEAWRNKRKWWGEEKRDAKGRVENREPLAM